MNGHGYQNATWWNKFSFQWVAPVYALFVKEEKVKAYQIEEDLDIDMEVLHKEEKTFLECYN